MAAVRNIKIAFADCSDNADLFEATLVIFTEPSGIVLRSPGNEISEIDKIPKPSLKTYYRI